MNDELEDPTTFQRGVASRENARDTLLALDDAEHQEPGTQYEFTLRLDLEDVPQARRELREMLPEHDAEGDDE